MIVCRFFALLATSLLLSSFALAQAPDELLDILDDLNKDQQTDDLLQIQNSHLSYVKTWQGVRPLRPVAGDTQTYHWAPVKGFVSPLDDQPISTLAALPEAGAYRVYLRHVLTEDRQRPVTLTITPQSGGKPVTHTFGKLLLASAKLGKEQEKELPIRVESDLQLNTPLDPQTAVWEYWDVDLPGGPKTLSLSAARQEPQVDAVLITRSKTFRPSFSYLANDNTLQRMFMRFRLSQVEQPPISYGVSAGLTYHWRGRLTPSGEVMWGHPIGQAKDIPVADWSPFIDATEAIVPGPGAWSTCRVAFDKIDNAQVEVEFAWYPHEAAVAHRFQASVSGGKAMFRVPHGSPQYLTAAEQPRWGIWQGDYLPNGAKPEADLVERYFDWAQEAAAELGLKEDHPRPSHLRFLSSCRVGMAHRARASEMLARLGVNWVEGAPPEVRERLHLYDDADQKKIKTGDEISTYTSPSTINASPPLLAQFHRYLEEQAALQGRTVRELLGVTETSRLRCLARLPSNPGRFERRLYYHSHRFCHQATIARYARATAAAEARSPGAIVYNNYSPHPVFLTGNSMNTTDWFLLSRAGAQTLGWGEDWATNGSWGLGTDRTQCVSFYAALVDCAVRKHDYPSGFYVGSNCGNSANKIFSCVAEGIDILHLYDWGPIDAWAEGSNAWSEFQSQYASIMSATHALGPADEIIAQGTREKRRAAVLYNRAHEIMNGGVTLNHDWMWAFIAMKSAQIPVDVIIEEDLTPAGLAQYDVLYLGGLNLEDRHLQQVSQWVDAGGLLIGTGGSAMYDAYNDLSPAAVELFGARSVLASPAEVTADETVAFAASEQFPAGTFTVAAPRGHRYRLEPTSGQPLAHFADESVACVTQKQGAGRTILFGFYPGYTFRANGRATGPVQPWFVQPLLQQLGRQRVEFSFPASEATLFEHPSGIAVTLANFAPWKAELSSQPTTLSVQTDRDIKQVISGLRGPLPWKREGDRIVIETPSAMDLTVDTIILK
ncbi:type 1 glutamine amidotransferase family protein [Lignipirellula cremea]|uniref:Beta-galactosidase trimerization domain protein n=1 Tax=Lignipirellula cremea TaxID=2528010 RepID=A0A518DNJ0_9BACT|nr:hypothetical protein [Lignipirellula cremea]QDU93402.1 hypothetical protein Pla8534_11820 [Lignipirellula cremea]